MNNRIVTADLTGSTYTVTERIYQYDYGQILLFSGISLPQVYEVHFSNEDNTGESKSVLGNADGVLIPDEYLLTGKSIYAWIFLHDTPEDGETVYKVMIPVIKRAEPTDIEPTPVQQDIITQAIAAVNDAETKWENMSAEAITLPAGFEATAEYNNGLLTLGIPNSRAVFS